MGKGLKARNAPKGFCEGFYRGSKVCTGPLGIPNPYLLLCTVLGREAQGGDTLTNDKPISQAPNKQALDFSTREGSRTVWLKELHLLAHVGGPNSLLCSSDFAIYQGAQFQVPE